MLRRLLDLESGVKLIIFFGTIIIGLFGFTIKSYLKITESLEIINNNQTAIQEIVLYKNITISSFIDKQFEKFEKDPSDLKKADIQVLTLYRKALALSYEQTYKIDEILEEVKKYDL